MKKILTPLLITLLLITSFISVQAVSLSDIDLINLNSNFATVTEVYQDETRVLYQKNADASMYPASLTKILTNYTAILNGPSLDTLVTIQYEDIAGLAEENASVAGFYEGQVVTFRDLLYGSMLPSGADASNAIARVISGSVPAYVELMNQTALELGLNNTNFINTTGLFEENHTTTTNDIALLTQIALKNDLFKEIFSTLNYTAPETEYNPGGLELESTILLYSQYDEEKIGYIMGGKTGWLSESGYCLSSYADFYDRTYVITTCDAYNIGDNLVDHNIIYQFLFENQHEITILNENQKLGDVHLIYQDNPDHYTIYNDEKIVKNLPIVIDYEDLDIDVNFISEIETPVAKGTPIGSVNITLADETVLETDYSFEEDIERNNFMYYTHSLINYFTSSAFIKLLIKIIVVLLLIFVLILLYSRLRRRNQQKGKYKGLKL